jgi:hypothetical protein
MVEFALVGGLFFFLIFSIMNAGFFLYSRSAVEHAADVGMQTLAAEGSCTVASLDGVPCAVVPSGCSVSNNNYADAIAICRMDAAGLTTTALITVTQVAIWRVTQQSPGIPQSTCGSGGTGFGTSPCMSLTCSTNGGPGTGGAACENIYTYPGEVPTQTQNQWPDASRDVSVGSGDFAELQIAFSYRIAGMPGATSISMTTTNVFRLEPQEL